MSSIRADVTRQTYRAPSHTNDIIRCPCERKDYTQKEAHGQDHLRRRVSLGKLPEAEQGHWEKSNKTDSEEDSL